ncbi:MAG: hypothetical protein KDD44_10565, partial [Bdellovibrionales bacterium]|nr:hypothetical protein [Bdellovibrionales bacterium]
MSTTLALGWRNIWRHPRRSSLTLLAVAFAAAVLVFFIGLQLSSYDASIQASISIYHGALQVQPAGYQDEPRIGTALDDPEQLRQKIERLAGVRAATIRAEGFALASSESRSYGVQIIGVEPEREGAVSTIPGVVRSGSWLS